MAFPLLNISPSQLDYQFEADREIKATLNLRNTHDARVAFKIKTTASDRFVVCPPAGICEPGTVRWVAIVHHAVLCYHNKDSSHSRG